MTARAKSLPAAPADRSRPGISARQIRFRRRASIARPGAVRVSSLRHPTRMRILPSCSPPTARSVTFYRVSRGAEAARSEPFFQDGSGFEFSEPVSTGEPQSSSAEQVRGPASAANRPRLLPRMTRSRFTPRLPNPRRPPGGSAQEETPDAGWATPHQRPSDPQFDLQPEAGRMLLAPPSLISTRP